MDNQKDTRKESKIFAVKVIVEKELLADAIAKAKAGAEINIDNAIEMNKREQGFVGVDKE